MIKKINNNLFANKFKKVIISIIIFIIIIAFIPLVLSDFSFRHSNSYDNKWITLGSKYVTDTMVLSNYQQSVQQNAQMISQNPLLLNDIFNDVLQKLSSSLVYASEAERMNIVISNDEIYKIIRLLPQLQDEQGNLNTVALNNLIQQYFGNEKVFLNAIRYSILQDNLTSSFLPLLNQYSYLSYLDFLAISQQRKVKYILLNNNNVKLTKQLPTTDELLSIRDENKELFTTPESRDGEVLIIPKLIINKQITPNNNELMQYYKQNINNFLQLEKRNVLQAVFDTEKEAKTFYNNLVNMQFNDLLNNKELINLGNIDKESSFTEQSVVSAIFSAKPQSIIKPVQSSVGWHVFVVNNITAAQPLSFEKAQPLVLKELTAVKLQEYKNNIKVLLKNKPNNTNILANIANQLNGKLLKFNNITENNIVKNVNSSEDIKQTILSLNSPRLSEILEDQNGNLYLVNITKISATKLLSVEEAKNSLIALWTEKHLSQQLQQLTDDLFKELSNGKIIETLGFKVLTTTVSRIDYNSIFDSATQEQLFAYNPSSNVKTPIKGVTTTNTIFIAVVDNVINSKENYLINNSVNTKVKQFILATNNFNNSILLESLNTELTKRFKVTVNEQSIQRRFEEAGGGQHN